MTGVRHKLLILKEENVAYASVLAYKGFTRPDKDQCLDRVVRRQEMLKKLQAVAVLLCMLSYATAGTVSIGTASARGDMRVDSYAVKGNATLFDGSVVETGQATADLRLAKGTEITMATGSRVTLYRDRLVLQRGESEVTSNSFQLEANGLRVTPREPNSQGVVSLKASNTVEVAALKGSFGVTTDQGVLLASVRPGHAVSFAMQAGATSTPFSARGMVTLENGHYYITTELGAKFEITGSDKDLNKYVGKKVEVTGTLSGGVVTAGGTTPTAVSLTTIGVNGGKEGISGTMILIITGVAVAAGVGLGVGIYEANQSSPPASR
jgi:hypothetical protein